MSFINFLRRSSFSLNRVVFYIAFAASVIFITSYFIPVLFDFALAILVFLVIAIGVDVLLLYSKNGGIAATREVAERLSNGDENRIAIEVQNNYGFKIHAKIIDELPPQFQERNWYRDAIIASGTATIIEYILKPLQRGEYNFGA